MTCSASSWVNYPSFKTQLALPSAGTRSSEETMEKAFITKDSTARLQNLNSFECSSPCELDRKFYEEQSLLCAMSPEQLSALRTSNSSAAEGCDSRVSSQASDHLSSDTISPFRGFPPNGLVPEDAHHCLLAVPLQGKSSTPQVLFLRPKRAACRNQSCSELSALQTSWDVSLIKSESGSPRFYTESSAAEQTWSPKPQLQSLVEDFPAAETGKVLTI